MEITDVFVIFFVETKTCIQLYIESLVTTRYTAVKVDRRGNANDFREQ